MSTEYNIKLSRLPYMSCLVYLYREPKSSCYSIFQNYLGNYINSSHFVLEEEYISENLKQEQAKSYALDQSLKFMQIKHGIKF